ncbi:MAG: DUF1549 and DUF1553 domain-containing protein [Mariniblastus sp.]|nr:DUF1549 and DUF1553 domain-containing protein [Mariniblastus sp.]
MKNRYWIKDIFLVACGLTGASLVGLLLLRSEPLEQPETFRPGGKQRQRIAEVARRIDDQFLAVYRQEGLEMADRADELTVVRRAALGLAGTLPSVEEIRELQRIETGHQVDWYVSRLLEDQRSSHYLAERFARVFVGVEEGPFLVFRRRRFVSWLEEQWLANRPYDQVVRQLLIDDGIWTDSPAVNFYTYNIIQGGDEAKPDPVRLAGRTSRAFLGMRIDCLQCHDDFLGNINLNSAEDPQSGLQLDFHQLASFFGDVENSLVGIRDNSSAPTYQYRLLDDEEEEAIQPRVPFNRELDTGQGNLRHRLANWVTHPENLPFARVTVNRMWAVMFGRGLVDPVDDIPLEGPFPRVMEILADDFIENGYDLHRLVRIIASTRAFQTKSDADFEVTEGHDENWAVFPLVRLRPEQVAGSVIQSTSLVTIDSTAHILTRLAGFGQQAEFINRYGDPGEDEFLERGETVTQRLLMLNGNMIQGYVSNGLNSPAHVGFLSPDPRTALEAVYLATLTRLPTDVETEHFCSELRELNGQAYNQKIQDIYWTLINSVEFGWNH